MQEKVVMGDLGEEGLNVWSYESFPGGASGKESACHFRRLKRLWFDPRVGKIPWRRKWQPTPVFLPGKGDEQWRLVGYSP